MSDKPGKDCPSHNPPECRNCAGTVSYIHLDVYRRQYLIKADDVIEIKESAKSMQRYKDNLDVTAGRLVPEWIDADVENFKGTIKNLPDVYKRQIPKRGFTNRNTKEIVAINVSALECFDNGATAVSYTHLVLRYPVAEESPGDRREPVMQDRVQPDLPSGQAAA